MELEGGWQDPFLKYSWGLKENLSMSYKQENK